MSVCVMVQWTAPREMTKALAVMMTSVVLTMADVVITAMILLMVPGATVKQGMLFLKTI